MNYVTVFTGINHKKYISSSEVSLYNAETEQGVAQAIIRSVIDFKREPWPRVSDNAKDLVKRMLDPDPKRRLTAQEVLGNILLFLLIMQIGYSTVGDL